MRRVLILGVGLALSLGWINLEASDPDRVYETKIQNPQAKDIIGEYSKSFEGETTPVMEFLTKEGFCIPGDNPQMLVDLVSPARLFSRQRPVFPFAFPEYQNALNVIADLIEKSDWFLLHYLRAIEENPQWAKSTRFWVSDALGASGRSWNRVFRTAIRNMIKAKRRSSGSLKTKMDKRLALADRYLWAKTLSWSERITKVGELDAVSKSKGIPAYATFFQLLMVLQFPYPQEQEAFLAMAEQYPRTGVPDEFGFTGPIRKEIARVLRKETDVLVKVAKRPIPSDDLKIWRDRVLRDLKLMPQILGSMTRSMDRLTRMMETIRQRRSVDKDAVFSFKGWSSQTMNANVALIEDFYRLVVPGEKMVLEVSFSPHTHGVERPVSFVEETAGEVIWTVKHPCFHTGVGVGSKDVGCRCRIAVPKAFVPRDGKRTEGVPSRFDTVLSRSEMGRVRKMGKPQTLEEWYEGWKRMYKEAFKDDRVKLAQTLRWHEQDYQERKAAVARGESWRKKTDIPIVVSPITKTSWACDHLTLSHKEDFHTVSTDQYMAMLKPKKKDKASFSTDVDLNTHTIKVTLFKLGFSHHTQTITLPSGLVSDFMQNIGNLYTQTVKKRMRRDHQHVIQKQVLSGFQNWVLGQDGAVEEPSVVIDVPKLLFDSVGGADAALGVPDVTWWRISKGK